MVLLWTSHGGLGSFGFFWFSQGFNANRGACGHIEIKEESSFGKAARLNQLGSPSQHLPQNQEFQEYQELCPLDQEFQGPRASPRHPGFLEFWIKGGGAIFLIFICVFLIFLKFVILQGY